MAAFYNTATLSYRDTSTNSNTVEGQLVQVLAAERCAVTRYQQICDMCFGKDYQTFKISAHILEQELDHEQDMEDYITDISEAMAHAKN